MKRRLWLRLSIAVGVDIAIMMSWRRDGRRIKADADVNSAELALKLDLPGGRLTDEFRAPIRPRESSGANISQLYCECGLIHGSRAAMIRRSWCYHEMFFPWYRCHSFVYQVLRWGRTRLSTRMGRRGVLPRPWEETRGTHVQVPLPGIFHTDLGDSTLNTVSVRRTCRQHIFPKQILLEACYPRWYSVLSHCRFKQTQSQSLMPL